MTETDAGRVVAGSAYLVTQSLVTTAIGAVALAFIARMLTQVEMGVIVALTLVLGIAQVLSDLGFSRGLTRYIAEYRGRNADYTVISFAGILMKTLTASSVGLVCVLAAPWLSNFLLRSGEYTFLFQLVTVNLLTFCMKHTINGLLLGVNRIREMAIFNVLSAATRQAFAVGLLAYGLGLDGVVMGWILGGFAYIIPSSLIIVRNNYVRTHPMKNVAPYLGMLARFSWPLFLTGVVVFVYNWFDRALLLAYTSLSDVAVYYIAIEAFSVLQFISLALTNTLFPYYSEQYGRNKQQKIAAGVRGASRYISLLYTPLALGLVVTASPVIRLFAGASYANGGIVLAVLGLLGAFTGVSAAFGGLLLVYNMTPTVLLINIASVGASLVALPILLPSLGATGMAIIKGTAMTISFILTIIALRPRMPIEFDKEAVWKGWSAALVMFGIVWLVERIYFSPYLLPFYVLVGGVTYVGSLRILKAVNKSDLQLIRNLVGKRVARIVDVLEKVLIH